MSFGKEIALFFFTKGPDIPFGGKIKNHFSCNCEAITNRLCTSPNRSFSIICANGYSNLKSHLLLCIPNYQMIYDNRENVVANMLNFVKVDKKTNNIFKWCELVVSENLCFSYVEKKLVRENSCREPISRGTLMKYLDSLAFEVQLVLANLLPERFGLIFDGWDDGSSNNYFGVFVIWWDVKLASNQVYLLRLCPLVRAADFGAASHLESIEKFLHDVGKTLANVGCFMGDNCRTNIALANRAEKPFIGCHSHRLNLAVKLYIVPYQHLLMKVSNFILNYLINDDIFSILRSHLSYPVSSTDQFSYDIVDDEEECWISQRGRMRSQADQTICSKMVRNFHDVATIYTDEAIPQCWCMGAYDSRSNSPSKSR